MNEHGAANIASHHRDITSAGNAPVSNVVIAGADMATSLGADRHETWTRVCAGETNFVPMTAIEQSPAAGIPHGGQAPALPATFHPNLQRAPRYLRWVIDGALADAGLPRGDSTRWPALRIGVVLGTTLHGIRPAGRFLRSGQPHDLQGFLAGDVLAAATVGLPINATTLTTCSACSSGLNAVALGVTLLRSGEVDMVIAAGYDPVSEYVFAGFNSLRLISSTTHRPFATDREGMKIAEGYAAVVLERRDDERLRRGNASRPLATIAGFGESADANHLTQPLQDGSQAGRAITVASVDARVSLSEVHLISAHATATPANDAAEAASLSYAFGSAKPPAIVGFKSHLGHTLGAAGLVELILSASAMNDQVLPPTANVPAASVAFPHVQLNTTGSASPATVNHTLTMSLGFGGANHAMMLERPAVTDSNTGGRTATDSHARSPRSQPRHDVWITGVGVVLPHAAGNDAFASVTNLASLDVNARDGEAIADGDIAHLINARRTRRLNRFVKLSLAAAGEACRTAGLTDLRAIGDRASVLFGSTHGAVSYCESFYRQVVDEGIDAANPMLFAEGVPNVASAHLSMSLGVTGSCQTIIGTRTAGLDAIRLAAMRIAEGRCDLAITGAAEEGNATSADVYRTLLDDPSFTMGEGAVVLILESAASAVARGAAPLGSIDAGITVTGLQHKTASQWRASRKQVADLAGHTPIWTHATLKHCERLERCLANRHGQPLPSTHASERWTSAVECFSFDPLIAVARALLRQQSSTTPPNRDCDGATVLAADRHGQATGIRFCWGDKRQNAATVDHVAGDRAEAEGHRA